MEDAAVTVNAATIRRAAMDLLARREHSRHELQQKLMRRFCEQNLVEQTLDRLCDEHLQSDTRYAEVYLHSRAQRLYGPIRIKAELRERGIAEDIVAAVFGAAAIDWSANLRRLESGKFGSRPPLDLREKAKRIRFLQYRGFGGIAAHCTN